MRTLLMIGIAILTCCPPAFALTMDEAIRDALQFNPRISRALALTDAAESRADQAQAPFWPSLDLDYSYWQADRDPNFSSSDLSTTTASASYNLFNGGSDWFRLDAAERRLEASKWERQSVIADAVLAVQRAYIEVLRAEQNVATEQQRLELLRQQYHETELRLEQGLLARNDLLRVSVEMATAKQNLLSAEGDVVVARQGLAGTLGRNLGDDEMLANVSLPEMSLGPFEQLQEEMFAARSELHYLKKLLAAQEADRKAVYGDMLPDIDLVLSYDRIGNDTYPDSSDPDYDSESRTMVQASWNLFNGFETRYELAGRKHELFALKEEIRATEDLLSVQLRRAVEVHRVASINLETARTSVQLAQENYRVNENRYKAQVATTVDLLDAQDFLTRARNEETKALYDLYAATAVIYRVLERQNIRRMMQDE